MYLKNHIYLPLLLLAICEKRLGALLKLSSLKHWFHGLFFKRNITEHAQKKFIFFLAKKFISLAKLKSETNQNAENY